MKLSTKALEAISGSGRVMNLIAAACDCTESTVRRWIHKNDAMLTTASNLAIIKRETGIEDAELLIHEETIN